MGPFDWRFYLAWRGRIERRAFFIGWMVIGVCGLLAQVPIAVFFGNDWPIGLYDYSILAVFTLQVVFGVSLHVRRAHDLGWPAAIPVAGWLALLVVVYALAAGWASLYASANPGWFVGMYGWAVFLVVSPNFVVSLFLLFASGQAGPNKYGPPPDKQLPG